ncbi:hypothetical protein BX666DRAFT_1928540 [Dichotomocladium elegans]|nr:hypothetical protein BX666DRAFT_1928540 [Dichotomocladium elegans]
MADSATSPHNDPSLSQLNPPSDKVPFFKKRTPKKNLRKRKSSTSPSRSQGNSDADNDDNDELISEVVTKERKATTTPFVQSTRRSRKKAHVAQVDEDDQSEEESIVGVRYAADRTAKTQQSDATRYATEWELENEALSKRTQTSASKKTTNSKMQVGPQRAPANIRVTARFDYQPDVCKDYKETGFCGYGDSCIFLHDRGDYKTGWQLEKEWEEAVKNKTKYGATDPNKYAVSDEDEDSDEELPFACLICREEFTNPVVTKCKHYFCEKCALDNYKKSVKCYACGASTGGVFDTAKKMIERLKAKKARTQESTSDADAGEDGGFQIEGLEDRKESSDEDDSDSE